MSNREFAFPCLHGLRGILALWVVVSHTSSGGSGVIQFLRYGGLAVDMFFCMSGFLLMHSHHQDFGQMSMASVRRFFLLRFWRTFPVHLITLCVAAAVSTLVFGFLPLTTQLMQSAIFVDTWLVPSISRSMNGPVWSLHYEWIGYLTFPWLCFALSRVRSVGMNVILLLIVLCLETGLLISSTTVLFTDVAAGCGAVGRMFGGLLIGCLFWTLSRDRTMRLPFGDWPMAVAIGLTVLILLRFPAVYALGPLLSVVLLAAYPGPVTIAILRGPIFAFCGRISFALYMVHYMIVQVVHFIQDGSHTGLPGAVFTGFAIAASISTATLICVLVEEPLRRFGRRGAGRPRNIAPLSALAPPPFQKQA